MTQRWATAAIVVLGSCLAFNIASARTITLDIERADVSSHTPPNANLGNYYVMSIAIPTKLPAESFLDAYLEFYVDATSNSEASAGLTTIEVFPLKSALSGEVDSSNLRSASMKRTVRVGESQRVRINISEHVRNVLKTPTDDFGLVIGSLTGQRLGKFALRQGVLGQGVFARVTIIYHELKVPESVLQ